MSSARYCAWIRTLLIRDFATVGNAGSDGRSPTYLYKGPELWEHHNGEEPGLRLGDASLGPAHQQESGPTAER
jgi:hypothetical protein